MMNINLPSLTPNPLRSRESSTKIRVLLVEDDYSDARLISIRLRQIHDGFEVEHTSTMEDSLRYLQEQQADVVLLDLHLPDSTGIETFRRLHASSPNAPVVILSSCENDELAHEAVRQGAQDYLPKSEAEGHVLRRCIEYAILRAEARTNLRELESARRIQQGFFPKHFPQYERFDFYGYCQPAALTGGDYFDFFSLADGTQAIALGDVSGHGLAPALIMAEARAVLRTLATTYADVGYILTRANRILCKDVLESAFVTLFLAQLSPDYLTLRYSSAGHPGFLIGGHGELKATLEGPLPPLGILPDDPFETEGPVKLQSGDVLVLLTDGITESFSPQRREQFGLQRALQVVRDVRQKPAREIVQELLAASRLFTSHNRYDDDVTVVVVKVLDEGSNIQQTEGSRPGA